MKDFILLYYQCFYEIRVGVCRVCLREGVFHWYLTPSRCGLGDNIYMSSSPFSVCGTISPVSLLIQFLIFSWIAMQNHWRMLFSRMRDLQAMDSLLLKELKSCCAKEYNFLPREAGLKLMETASKEVAHWPDFPFLAACADIWVCWNGCYFQWCLSNV